MTDFLTLDGLRRLAAQAVDDSPDTRTQAAARIGVGRSTVSRALSEQHEDLPDVVVALAEAYAGARVTPGFRVETED